MTIAVCNYCGEFKFGSLNECPLCGKRPVDAEDMYVAMWLSDHYHSQDDLQEYANTIKTGTQFSIPEYALEEIKKSKECKLLMRLQRRMGNTPS